MAKQQEDAWKQLLVNRYSDFEFVDDTNDFKCVRCYKIPITHYLTSCGHLLCQNCKRNIDNGGIKCPQCSSQITHANGYLEDFERRLLTLRTKCPNHKYGCRFITNLAQIAKHIKTCEYTREAVPRASYKGNRDSVLKIPDDVLLALQRQQSKEMQDFFNTQMEMERGNYYEELQKVVKRVDYLETQMDNTPQKFNKLSDELFRLRKGLDETNTKWDNLEDVYVLVPKKKVSLLLVGPTGVGKSTFINAFVNYLKFKDLEEAQRSELKCLIPCAFTIYENQYQTRDVRFGEEDANENTGVQDQSATQNCKSYKVEVNNLTLTIIDTPGFGDTRGEGQDLRNVNRIIDFVALYDRLVIAVLLKPNETKLTAAFENCMRKLLSHFYLTATKEVVFLFTNSRSFFYKPGDTILPLKEILKRLQKPPLATKFEIKFTKENVFCMDNEAFRYLVAQRNGVRFNENDYDNFKKSWQKSAEECNRMINCIKGETTASSEDHDEVRHFHDQKSRQY